MKQNEAEAEATTWLSTVFKKAPSSRETRTIGLNAKAAQKPHNDLAGSHVGQYIYMYRTHRLPTFGISAEWKTLPPRKSSCVVTNCSKLASTICSS